MLRKQKNYHSKYKLQAIDPNSLKAITNRRIY